LLLITENLKIKVYKTITLPVVLCGCGTWFLTLKEEHRSVFQSRVMRRLFAPIREEVVVGWRRLHNEELHNFYTSPNIIF
jgi:hypothetical protein